MVNETLIECKEVKFYSKNDEANFFKSLKKIKCIKNIKGVGKKIVLFIENELISKKDINEINSLFRRYNINTKELNPLINKENKMLFSYYKNHFHMNVYPARD